MYAGKTELTQETAGKVVSIILLLCYIVIIACTFLLFLFALDYGLDLSFSIN